MLAAGVGFLLRDLNVWTFWNVSWWSVVLLLWGLGSIGMTMCKDCMKMCK